MTCVNLCIHSTGCIYGLILFKFSRNMPTILVYYIFDEFKNQNQTTLDSLFRKAS